MHATALYYPWVNFPDDRWLKLSVLLWDRVLRIAPARLLQAQPSTGSQASDRRSDGYALASLLEEAGLVRSIDPRPSGQAVARKISEVIVAHGEELRRRYGIGQRAWQELWRADRGLTYIHADKMSRGLIEQLVDAGLGQWDPEGWVVAHPDFARVYMSALAEQVANETGSSPITDDPLSHVAAGGWSPERIAGTLLGVSDSDRTRDADESVAALAFVAFRVAVPGGLEDLSVTRVLEVRDAYGRELRAFRCELAAIIADAALASDGYPAEYEKQLRDLYIERIKPQLDRLRAKLKVLRLQTLESVMSVKTTLPPIAALALAEHAPHDSQSTTGVAVTAGVFQLRRALAARARAELADNPAAYLLRLQDAADADARPLVSAIRSTARRLALGV